MNEQAVQRDLASVTPCVRSTASDGTSDLEMHPACFDARVLSPGSLPSHPNTWTRHRAHLAALNYFLKHLDFAGFPLEICARRNKMMIDAYQCHSYEDFFAKTVSVDSASSRVQMQSHAEEDLSMDDRNGTVAMRLGYTDSNLDGLEDNVKGALHNTGNMCYLNSLLHVVARVDSFRHWFQGHLARSHIEHSWQTCPLCAIAQDVNRLCIDVDTAPFVPNIVASRGSWSHGEFANAEQQDVTEAVRLLFDSLNAVDERSLLATDPGAFDGVSGIALKYTTPMWRLMEMSFSNRLHCTMCNEQVIMPERLSAVPLELPTESCTVELLLANQWGDQPEGDDPFKCPAVFPKMTM